MHSSSTPSRASTTRRSHAPMSRWSRTRAVGAHARFPSSDPRRVSGRPPSAGCELAGTGALPAFRGLPTCLVIGTVPLTLMRHPPATLTLAAALLLLPAAAGARSPGDPVRLVWAEGDVAGTSTIYGPDGGEPIGFIEYRQTRHGDRLSSVRLAHFRGGSGDEDSAAARVEGTLEALAGRTIIREADGVPAVDGTIDVAGSRIAPSWGRGAHRRTLEERGALPKGTYLGPAIFIPLKHFDPNAAHGRPVLRPVAP